MGRQKGFDLAPEGFVRARRVKKRRPIRRGLIQDFFEQSLDLLPLRLIHGESAFSMEAWLNLA